MKVLEKGKWDLPWSAELSCAEKECGAKLLVEESDVKAVDYSSPAKYSAVCAVCGVSLSLSPATLPLRLKNAVDKKKKFSSDYWD